MDAKNEYEKWLIDDEINAIRNCKKTIKTLFWVCSKIGIYRISDMEDFLNRI